MVGVVVDVVVVVAAECILVTTVVLAARRDGEAAQHWAVHAVQHSHLAKRRAVQRARCVKLPTVPSP